MKEFENNAFFWQKVDTLVSSCSVSSFWNKGSQHPDYPTLTFPLDSGMLAMDNIAVAQYYKGTCGNKVDGLIIICDILDKQFRSVLLIGTSIKEQEEVLQFINQNEYKKCVCLRRGNEVPTWATFEDDED